MSDTKISERTAPTACSALDRAAAGGRLEAREAAALANTTAMNRLLDTARHLRDQYYPHNVTYSRKVFIPLTKLCRDSCHYCTFAHGPKPGESAFLSRDSVLEIARAGAAAGCKEALFTLGDKPELRYRKAADELRGLGHGSTLSYLAEMARLVFLETGLLPHINAGVMDRSDITMLRQVSASQGLMLESISPRLAGKGQPHHGSPDKDPQVRLAMIRAAGEARVPFTSGLLIGIGETRLERIEAMLALRDLHEAHGHIQEIIIQNFRAKPGTRMSGAEEPAFEDHLWTIAVARLIFGPAMSIQAPPNLSTGALESLVAAGINDWGGVSPVTPDHVNPEAPWPHVPALAEATRRAGKHLAERLTIYPSYLRHPDVWVDPSLKAAVLAASDSEGLARTGSWTPGSATPMDLQPAVHRARAASDCIETVLDRALTGRDLQEAEIAALFAARDDSFDRVCAAADELRRNVNGETVTYVVNRNINYTNVCYFKCQFCAFSKGKLSENLRGRPYDLPMEEIVRRAIEAHERGATEVCLQGGIHPDYTGQKYIDIVRALKTAVPQIHVHAFSPLEVWQGAETLGLSVRAYLERLRGEGLGTLPGTAAEILDDEVRAVICPDKINTAQWLKVMAEAHAVGLSTTATIMFGHVDAPLHWARHLLRIRALQRETGGFTEFVPLPFVPMETPLFLKGRARRGPTARETVLMHAVARLALHPHVTNIQASWVKLGRQGVGACLRAGVNDLGGTLMNETISRSAGASHGQELAPAGMEAWIKEAGRTPRQRTTTYGVAPLAQMRSSFDAQPLLEPRLRIDLQYERVPADHSPEQECL